MNPAYITRQVHELSFKKLGIIGHITSLDPIRQANAPDEWEINALKEFEKGVDEYSGFSIINDEKYFRYMHPLITEEGCLKCHEAQGYKVGDIRGGISSTVPWKSYQASIESQTWKMFLGYGFIWVLGFIGISMVKTRFYIYITRRDIHEKEILELNEELHNSKNIIEDNLVQKNILIEDLTETRDKLEKLNSEKDKFFSIIAHDLKSPFQGFIGLTEVMSEGGNEFTKDEITTLSKEIHDNAKNLYKLLQNLLDWALMQQGKLSFAPEEILLSEALRQNIALISKRGEQKGVEIVLDDPGDQKVYADESMLNSILRNLLSNAVKFTKPGGKVIVSAKEKDTKVEIAVRDSGIGMSEEIRRQLFKMEENVGRKGTDGEESTGLGLLLCKEFVEKHDGKIWVESEEEDALNNKFGGSTFYFTIGRMADSSL